MVKNLTAVITKSVNYAHAMHNNASNVSPNTESALPGQRPGSNIYIHVYVYIYMSTSSI